MTPLTSPVVGLAPLGTGKGCWLVSRAGEVFPLGDAQPLGDLADDEHAPISGIVATPSGGGYWLLASDGRVTAFGDARRFLSE